MTDLRAHDMGELATMVPHLLGYHPGRSLVLIAHTGSRVGPILRVELSRAAQWAGVAHPALGVPAAGVSTWSRDDPLVRSLAALAKVSDRILVFAFEEFAGESLAWDRVVRDLAAVFEVPIEQTVRVRAGRWYWIVDGVEIDGGMVPAEPDVPGIADLVLSGSAPLASRESLVDLVRGVSAEAEAVAALLAKARGSRAAAAGPGRPRRSQPRRIIRDAHRGLLAWAVVLTPGTESTLRPELVAEALLALDDLELRDCVLGWIAPAYGLPPGDLPHRLREALVHAFGVRGRPPDREMRLRLLALCAATPLTQRAPVLTLLAVQAWSTGDGAMARVAADEALLIDPGYRMAQLIAVMIEWLVRAPAQPEAGAQSRASA